MSLTKWKVIYVNEKWEKKEEIIESFKSQIDFALWEINEEMEHYAEYWDIIELKKISN